jgi:NAD(P)H-flavin reductase
MNMAQGEAAMVPLWYQVQRVQRETHDVATLEMVPADGSAPLVFAPGQFNMLYVFGVGEVPISISGDPARPGKLVHTIRSVGAVTRALCRLKRGDSLGMRGPFGTSWPVERGLQKDVVLIAGGLGMVPLRPALYALLARRSAYRNIALLYGARTPQEVVYQREINRWQQRPDLQVEVTVDAAGPDWRGHVGLVTKLIARLRFDPRETLALVCGPEIMMRFTVWELMHQGVAAESMFLSLERNMKCGVGLCGHCQYGPFFVCKDGPVMSFQRLRDWFEKREI